MFSTFIILEVKQEVTRLTRSLNLSTLAGQTSSLQPVKLPPEKKEKK